MSKVNVFSIILIYDLISSTLITDKDFIDHEYISSVLYENNYKIICLTKTTIELWNYAFVRKNKFILIFIWKQMTNNKILYHIYEF